MMTSAASSMTAIKNSVKSFVRIRNSVSVTGTSSEAKSGGWVCTLPQPIDPESASNRTTPAAGRVWDGATAA